MLTRPLRVAPLLRTSLWSEYLQGPESSLSLSVLSLSLPLKTKATKTYWTQTAMKPLQVHFFFSFFSKSPSQTHSWTSACKNDEDCSTGKV